jgi:hypothetical protein
MMEGRRTGGCLSGDRQSWPDLTRSQIGAWDLEAQFDWRRGSGTAWASIVGSAVDDFLKVLCCHHIFGMATSPLLAVLGMVEFGITRQHSAGKGSPKGVFASHHGRLAGTASIGSECQVTRQLLRFSISPNPRPQNRL